MPRNIEIKASIDRIADIEPRVAALATAGPTIIQQDDSFFACAQGRLKLRRFADGSGELIAYQRPDQAGPKASTYVRTPAADPVSMLAALTAACGLLGRVRKRRTLYLAGRTRVHLDDVEGLGCFLELEVLLADGEPESAGITEAEAWMARLGLARHSLVEPAYLDLLATLPSAGAATGAPHPV